MYRAWRARCRLTLTASAGVTSHRRHGSEEQDDRIAPALSRALASVEVMADPSVAKSYGQAVLDAVAAPEDDEALIGLATRRARAVGEVHVSVQEFGQVETDLSDALSGTLMLVRTLLTMVEEADGRAHDEVIEEARRRFIARWPR